MAEVVSSPNYTDEKIEYDLNSVDEQIVVEQDPRQRFPEETQFTWRSAIIGSLLGCLVGNIIIV
jgi:hypothetical protein